MPKKLPVKYRVVKYPDPILSKQAEEVLQVTAETRRLIMDMLSIMYADKGVGLAAPQIGISKRIFVANPTGEKGDAEYVFINPVLSNFQGEVSGPEGCLSLPGISAEVPRAESITVEAVDADGKNIHMEAHDFLARVIQHENDHLEGKLFIDRIPFLERQKLLAEYQSNSGVAIEAPSNERRFFRFL